MAKVKLLIFLFLVSMGNYVTAQGCSDAGFCTTSSIKTTTEKDTLKNSLKVGFNYGAADFDIAVIGSYLEYKLAFSEQFSLSSKVTYTSQQSESLSSSSLSDLFVLSDYKIRPKTAVSFGFKIPFTTGNLKQNGQATPMDLQPSLGTFDLVLGITQNWKKFGFALGYQHPLSQNKNTYFKPATEKKYFSTNGFERSSDVLLRATYAQNISKKWQLTIGLLGIYHTKDDEFVSASGVKTKIKGSNGLTINALAYFNYNINPTNAIEIALGTPLLVREARPDGLTRSFVANIEYRIRF